MKITLKIALVLVAFASQARAVSVYELETAVIGGGQLGIMDMGGGGVRIPDGSATVNYGNLMEKIYVDFETSMYRLVGGFDLNLTRNPFTIEEPVNERTGREVDGELTVVQSFAGPVSFDTGYRPLSFDSANHALGSPGSGPVLPQVNGSWILSTGGKTYSDDFNYDPEGLLIGFHFTDLTFSSDRSELSLAGVSQRAAFYSGLKVAEFTADNGFHIYLKPGFSDFTNHFNWSVGPTVATIASVPDAGNTLGLLLFGLMGLACWRRT